MILGGLRLKNGGEGGIRTLGELPHTAFRVRRTRPLCDLSGGDYDPRGALESRRRAKRETDWQKVCCILHGIGTLDVLSDQVDSGSLRLQILTEIAHRRGYESGWGQAEEAV